MSEKTTDALKIIEAVLLRDDTRLQLQIEKERVNALAAQIIYDLRVQHGMSQRELAERVGTSASAICRLEDSDYGSHTLNMLVRILFVFGHRLALDVRLIGLERTGETTQDNVWDLFSAEDDTELSAVTVSDGTYGVRSVT